MTETNLEERMQMWRDGMLSGSEILGDLLAAQAEVLISMRNEETKVAEERIKHLGV